MGQNFLTGQVVIVTGASSGIGHATARAMDAAGAKVVLAARRVDRISELARSMPRAVAVGCDVTSERDVAQLVSVAHEAFGQVGGLVNNAGYASFAPLHETTPDEWRRMLDVNVTGSFLCAHAVLGEMRERGSGWIINVCSDVSRRVFPRGGAYCASKHAQLALSHALGVEGRPHGVRVGAVLPGMVATEFAGAKLEQRQDWELRAEDVANAIVYMASRPGHAVVDELTVHPVRQDYV